MIIRILTLAVMAAAVAHGEAAAAPAALSGCPKTVQEARVLASEWKVTKEIRYNILRFDPKDVTVFGERPTELYGVWTMNGDLQRLDFRLRRDPGAYAAQILQAHAAEASRNRCTPGAALCEMSFADEQGVGLERLFLGQREPLDQTSAGVYLACYYD